MSLAHRIIPCLDTDGARVVKGVHFVGLRDAGDPVALAARYNAEGADELVVPFSKPSAASLPNWQFRSPLVVEFVLWKMAARSFVRARTKSL